MNSNENIIKSYASSPQSLISFMGNSQDGWWIKDKQSKYIYANNAILRDASLPKNFNVEGRLDIDIPAPCEELHEEFVEHDKKVMTENRIISAIAISYYGEGNSVTPVPHLQEKAPLYDDQKNVIGTIGHGRIINSPALLFYMHRFNRKTIQFDAPNNLFTKRELDVIFWALQRLSSKEIAKRLNLSPRTVETKLQVIYDKAGVSSKVQLEEYCKHTGLDTYIPTDFLRNGLQFIK